LLSAAALVAMFVGPAAAADLPVRAPVLKAPVAAPIYNWTGFYTASSVGGQW
jgi:outer membrane immunogenic protein